MEFKKYSIIIVNVLIFMNIILLYNYILRLQPEYKLQQRLFPDNFSKWVGEDVIYQKEIINVLEPDRIVYKSYYRPDKLPVTLFVAYYGTLEKADMSHSPVVCFTGQGWDVLEAKKVEVPVGPSRKISVNQIFQKKADTSMITLYWYQSFDRVFGNRGIMKLYLFLDRLLGKPDGNAFVRITMSFSNGNDIMKQKSDLYEFVDDVFPELRRYLFEGR